MTGLTISGAAASLLAAAGTAALKARHRRRERMATVVRPLLHRALDQGGIDDGRIAALSPGQRRQFDRQARSLLPKLRGQDHDVLAHLLEQRGAIDTLRRQSHHWHASKRAKAAELLGQSGLVAVLADLVHLLRDPNAEVRRAAAQAIAHLGDPLGIPPLLAAVDGRRALPVDVVADALFQMRDFPLSLMLGLRSRSVRTRALTVEILGRNRMPAGTESLIAMLSEDPSLEVRSRAARALGRIGSPLAVGPLKDALEHGPPDLRGQAAWALGEIGGSEAIRPLREALFGPSRVVSESAARALVRVGPDGTELLARAAQGDSGAAAVARTALASRERLSTGGGRK